MSVDTKDSPIAAQSWYLLQDLRRREADCRTSQNPTEYFRDLRDFPAYNRIRNQFFPEPPVSMVVRALELLKV